MYAAAAARRSEPVEAARRAAAARFKAAGDRMRKRAWWRLCATLDAQELAPGDLVRVSLLVLPHVRRLLKSQLVGDPLPLFSTSIFRVAAARRAARHTRVTYDLAPPVTRPTHCRASWAGAWRSCPRCCLAWSAATSCTSPPA